jgi:two-component system NtrC family sensor kinase
MEVLKVSIQQNDLEKAKKIQADISEIEKRVDIGYILSDVSDLLRESQEGVERIKKIVLDLKTFSRSDESAKSPVEMNKLLDSIVNIVWNEIKYKAELKKDYQKLPLIECNPQQIGQVFLNILINAAQSIEEKGTIGIRTYAQERRIYVEISDTGAGMSPEVMERLFEPFFTTKMRGKGTGLGLSISREIVKKHGGEIKVESQPGKGSKFTVILPGAE